MDDSRSEQQGVAPAREPSREGAPSAAAENDQQRASGRVGGGGRRDPRRRRHGGREGQGAPQAQSHRPEPSLNMEELRELLSMFTAQGLTEFELEKEGFRVRVRRDLSPQAQAGAPALAAVPSQQSAQVLPFVAPQITQVAAEGQPAAASQPATETSGPAASAEAELHVITSPIVGTFYRAPSPTADPFVRVGSHVGPDTVVCIIEAMKLMNEILAETSGTVEKIFVENGTPVEYGQPLFGIKKQ